VHVVCREKKKKDTEASYYTPPPVYMSDDENEENGAALSDSLPSLDADLKDSSEYKELVALLKFKQHNEKKSNERIVDPAEAAQTVTHEGYKVSLLSMLSIDTMFTCYSAIVVEQNPS
jgi:hypothetical protein